MALDYNRDIKNSKYSLRKAEYAIDEARAGRAPVVDYTFSAQRARSAAASSNSTNAISNAFGNTLAVSIPLYTGGKVEGNIDVAKLSKVNAQEEILRVEQATKYWPLKATMPSLPIRNYKASIRKPSPTSRAI